MCVNMKLMEERRSIGICEEKLCEEGIHVNDMKKKIWWSVAYEDMKKKYVNSDNEDEERNSQCIEERRENSVCNNVSMKRYEICVPVESENEWYMIWPYYYSYYWPIIRSGKKKWRRRNWRRYIYSVCE